MGTRGRPQHLYERVADTIRDHPAAGTARIGSLIGRTCRSAPCSLSVDR
jgi:hypothetical protein